MTSVYLKNMPSVNGENFSKFQAGISQPIIRQSSSLFHCAKDKDYQTQLIVNEKFNIVVKYLKKPVENEKSIRNVNKSSSGNKRELSQVLRTSVTTDPTNYDLSQFLKRHRTLE